MHDGVNAKRSRGKFAGVIGQEATFLSIDTCDLDQVGLRPTSRRLQLEEIDAVTIAMEKLNVTRNITESARELG